MGIEPPFHPSLWWRDVVFGAGERRCWMPAPDCVDILPSQVAGLDIADLLRWTLASGNCSGNGHMDVEGSIANELFGGGFTTITESFRWAINLLAASPDVQERARRELAEVCGDRPLRLTDRSNIPYNEAVHLEIFRYSSLTALGLPHSTMEDTTLRGYFIPKGTTIFSNYFAHHYNPQYFPDPDSFKPDRFLTADGKLDTDKAQLVVPFGVGKRRCVGENLARQELSLFVGRLLQQFEIHEDPCNPVNIRDVLPGLNRGPIQTPLIFNKIVL
uniref:Cytochrome P450 n=1 Tax=Plectus sambesii TaxID=2011161 RepID=A0A914VL68_9BILA